MNSSYIYMHNEYMYKKFFLEHEDVYSVPLGINWGSGSL